MSSYLWPNDDGWPYPDSVAELADPDAGVDEQGCVVRRELALPGEAIDEHEAGPLGERLGGEDEVDAQAAALVEVAGPVIPPGVDPGLGTALAEDVHQAPPFEGGHRFPFGRAHVGAAVELGRIPGVDVLRGDVEVPAHDHGRQRVAGRL